MRTPAALVCLLLVVSSSEGQDKWSWSSNNLTRPSSDALPPGTKPAQGESRLFLKPLLEALNGGPIYPQVYAPAYLPPYYPPHPYPPPYTGPHPPPYTGHYPPPYTGHYPPPYAGPHPPPYTGPYTPPYTGPYPPPYTRPHPPPYTGPHPPPYTGPHPPPYTGPYPPPYAGPYPPPYTGPYPPRPYPGPVNPHPPTHGGQCFCAHPNECHPPYATYGSCGYGRFQCCPTHGYGPGPVPPYHIGPSAPFFRSNQKKN